MIISTEKTMKIKKDDLVQLYTDDTDEYHLGVVKEISSDNRIWVSFAGGEWSFAENELTKLSFNGG